MRAVRQFTVIPAIPPALEPLRELATNLHWTWDRETQHLFDRLDPAGWLASGHDPLRLLATIDPARWAELAADPAIVEADRRGQGPARRRAARPALVPGPRTTRRCTWSPTSRPSSASARPCRSTRGGLGVLAGDHLKATSDLGVPLVAVGLLYAEGYFRQRLNADG